MGKSLAMYMSLLRVLLRLAGVRSQVVEIEPGTVVHFWAPAENPSKTKIHNQAKRKPAVVFLHGFGFNGISTWQFQMLALAKDYAIYVPDFLFFGGSVTDKTERSPAFQAECMAKGLKKLGVEKCTLVGLSYGGMVGFKMAEMYPDLVDSMVVTCSVMALTESITRSALERIGFSSWAEVLIPETFEGVKKIAELCTYKSLAMPDFFYRDIFQDMFINHKKERVELLEALQVKDKDFYIPHYPRIHLLWGEEDETARGQSDVALRREGRACGSIGTTVRLQQATQENPCLFAYLMKRAQTVMTAHYKRPLNDSEILIQVELGSGNLKSIRAQNMNQIWKEEHRTASTEERWWSNEEHLTSMDMQRRTKKQSSSYDDRSIRFPQTCLQDDKQCFFTSSADFTPPTALAIFCHLSGVSLSNKASAFSNSLFSLGVQADLEFLEA
ncbi:hypothetical protein NC651_022741 [Populus alba x Populus x berolinensis]|nr:hypothetical protein NC651_022741 [Populus alba x Populus x berolinensis]